ncbi:MAG: WD40 repeat domain-containing protein [Methylococcaceae bacterium]
MNVLLSLLQKMLIGSFLLVMIGLAVTALFKKLIPASSHGTISWSEVQHENTLESYIDYLRECASCPHAKEANAIVDDAQKKIGLIARLDRKNLPEQEDFSALAFAPDGKTIAAAGVDRLHFWDATTGELRPVADRAFRVVRGQRTMSLRYSLGGKQIAAGTASRTGEGSLMVWDANNGELLAHHTVQDHDIRLVAFAPRSIGIGWLADGPVGIWEPRTDRIMRAIHEGAAALSFVRDDTDQLRLITAGEREIWLWNPDTLEPVEKIKIKTEKSLFGISYDGKVALYRDDQGQEVWEPLTGKLLASLPRLDGGLTAFCRDSRRGRLVLGTSKGTIHLWDVSSNAHLAQALAHHNAIEELTCSSHGRFVSRSIDSAKLWNLDALVSGQSQHPPHSE